jgi:hypothetical protein
VGEAAIGGRNRVVEKACQEGAGEIFLQTIENKEKKSFGILPINSRESVSLNQPQKNKGKSGTEGRCGFLNLTPAISASLRTQKKSQLTAFIEVFLAHRRCVLECDSGRSRRLLLFCGGNAAEWWPGMSKNMAGQAVVRMNEVNARSSEDCWTETELRVAPKAGAQAEFLTSPECDGENGAEHLDAAVERVLRARGDAFVDGLMDKTLAGDPLSAKLLMELLTRKTTRKKRSDSPLRRLVQRWATEPEWPGVPVNEETAEVDAED